MAGGRAHSSGCQLGRSLRRRPGPQFVARYILFYNIQSNNWGGSGPSEEPPLGKQVSKVIARLGH